jgi:tetratricopeptide (TPR) repeat protein
MMMSENPENSASDARFNPEAHPDRELLDRFMRGDVRSPEKRQVVRHLLGGCPQCVAVTRSIWLFAGGLPVVTGLLGPDAGALASLPSFAAIEDTKYDPSLLRALDAGHRREEQMAAERETAPALLAQLLAEPGEKRLPLVRRNGRYQTVALVDLLLDFQRSSKTPAHGEMRDTTQAVDIAELAVAIAERLDPEDCGLTVVRDLLGRAWTQAGEARRLAGDLPGAERAARSAAPLLEAATPGERLDFLRLEAAVAADRGRFEEADRLLARAAEACRAAGEIHLTGNALVERGTLHATSGRYESAIELLGEGADLLEAETDPALLASALHRRADLLFEVGRGEEARAAAGHLLPLYERQGDRHGLLRLHWLLGKIEEDEAKLLQVRSGLLDAGLGLAAAQISLDLAVVYARKGCWGEIRRLAAEIFPILRTRDLRRESMAGLLVFRRAVETESASLEFLIEVAGYLLGSRRTRWGSA